MAKVLVINGIVRMKLPTRRSVLTYVSGVGVAFIAGMLVHSSLSASVATFIPGSCLGGWDNPQHAQGTFQVESSDRSQFLKRNSAVLEDRIAQIFCGKFDGKIPDEGRPTKVSVKLSLAMKSKAESEADETLASKASEIVTDNFENAVNDIVSLPEGAETSVTIVDPPQETPPSSDTTQDQVSPSELLQEGASSQEEVPPINQVQSSEEAPSPAPSVETVLPPAEPSAPQSFLWRFFTRYAHAQEDTSLQSAEVSETGVSESSTREDTQSAETQTRELSSSEESLDPVMTLADGTLLHTETPTTTASSSIPSVDDGFLEVSYSLDGEEWHVLGKVPSGTVGGYSFELPEGAIAEWSALDTMQVKVENSPTLDEQPVVFLDGIAVDVEYEYDDGDLYLAPPQPQFSLVDFRSLTLEELKAMPTYAVAKIVNASGTPSLLFFPDVSVDTGTSTHYVIARPSMIATSSPIGVKSGYVFWLSPKGNLIGFDTSLVRYVLNVESRKEEGNLIFDVKELDVAVLVRGDSLVFRGKEGEFLSDDDTSAREKFTQFFNLSDLGLREDLIQLHLIAPLQE